MKPSNNNNTAINPGYDTNNIAHVDAPTIPRRLALANSSDDGHPKLPKEGQITEGRGVDHNISPGAGGATPVQSPNVPSVPPSRPMRRPNMIPHRSNNANTNATTVNDANDAKMAALDHLRTMGEDDTIPKQTAQDMAEQRERMRIIEQTRARLLGIPATAVPQDDRKASVTFTHLIIITS